MSIKKIDWRTGELIDVEQAKLQRGQVLICNNPCYPSSCWLEKIDKTQRSWEYTYIVETYDEDGNEKYHRSRTTEIRPYSQVFGIGIYYNDSKEPEIISEEAIAELARKCDLQREKEIAEELQRETERKAAIERGKQLFAEAEEKLGFKPQSVIVAEYRVDDSDCQSDYFSSHAAKIVVIAFSKHNRDLFSELRKAAADCSTPEIKALAVAPKEYEHREKYSMGAGYYLGESRYCGVIIRKASIHDYTYMAAGKEGCFKVLHK